MDKKNTKNAKNIISVILAFILTIDLFFLSIFASTIYSVFDKSYVEEKLLNSGYYKETLKEVIDNFETLGIPGGGIPREVFEGAVNEVGIYNDFSNILDASFNGKTYRIDTKTLEKNLKDSLLRYADSQYGGVTQEESENLDGLIDYCADSYRTLIDNKVISYLGQVKVKTDKLVIPGFIGIIAFAVFLLIFIYKLHYYKHRALRYISYSFLASFIMTAIIPIFLLTNKIYARLQITPEYVYNFIIKMIEGFLVYLLYSGVIMGVIAACLIVAIAIIKKKYTEGTVKRNW